ncbi:MAG: polysaccharide biosynthesis protein [Desulfomicrobium sp.]|nr:polysaccharide biosynthesis protein [Desulfomicrobium sp.]
MKSFFSDKRVLVTGCCGTVGREVVSHLVNTYGIGELVGLDNNESELFFDEQVWSAHAGMSFFLSDVRDLSDLKAKMEDVDIVFHTAAFKHVGLCERAPMQAVQNNIVGVQNIIEAATAQKVDRVIFTSSDKAVNPTNVMGTSKLMGERLMTAANSNARNGITKFASTRFGNVLGSRGSVIPIFFEQIRRGGPVTVTDNTMSRFIMSIQEAAELVIDSSTDVRGGEVFITKMPVIRIRDLAEVMIRELAPRFGHDPEGIEISIIGSKPGEKMYEELMSLEETRRTLELDRYFVVLPAFRNYYKEIDYKYSGLQSSVVENPYHSGNEVPLSQEVLRQFLLKHNLLEQ